MVLLCDPVITEANFTADNVYIMYKLIRHVTNDKINNDFKIDKIKMIIPFVEF